MPSVNHLPKPTTRMDLPEGIQRFSHDHRDHHRASQRRTAPTNQARHSLVCGRRRHLGMPDPVRHSGTPSGFAFHAWNSPVAGSSCRRCFGMRRGKQRWRRRWWRQYSRSWNDSRQLHRHNYRRIQLGDRNLHGYPRRPIVRASTTKPYLFPGVRLLFAIQLRSSWQFRLPARYLACAATGSFNAISFECGGTVTATPLAR